MGILDEAIREHLELKRQHGAEQSELRQIEDEAFGPPARPGDAEGEVSPSEAPTEFMPAEGEAPPAPGEETIVQQPEPPQQEAPPAPEAAPEPDQAAAAPEPADPEPEPAVPLDEEHPAGELSIEGSPSPDAPPSTEEREAIAAQPTELHDVPAELEDDEFFDAKSLSDELDQALEEPVPDAEPAAPAEPDSFEPESAPEPEGADEPEPAAEPAEAIEPELAPEAEAGAASEPGQEAEPTGEPEEERSGGFFDQESDDVLEETPEFLQDTPENERLWFEQKPPKDFDFDD